MSNQVFSKACSRRVSSSRVMYKKKREKERAIVYNTRIEWESAFAEGHAVISSSLAKDDTKKKENSMTCQLMEGLYCTHNQSMVWQSDVRRWAEGSCFFLSLLEHCFNIIISPKTLAREIYIYMDEVFYTRSVTDMINKQFLEEL